MPLCNICSGSFGFSPTWDSFYTLPPLFTTFWMLTPFTRASLLLVTTLPIVHRATQRVLFMGLVRGCSSGLQEKVFRTCSVFGTEDEVGVVEAYQHLNSLLRVFEGYISQIGILFRRCLPFFVPGYSFHVKNQCCECSHPRVHYQCKWYIFPTSSPSLKPWMLLSWSTFQPYDWCWLLILVWLRWFLDGW